MLSHKAVFLRFENIPRKMAKTTLEKADLRRAWELMCVARAMSDLYEEKSQITQKYVHATSRGHEALQLALGLQLKPQEIGRAHV